MELETTVDLLEKALHGKLRSFELQNALTKRRVLGFGVQAMDIVRVLQARGIVDYDSRSEVVSLVNTPEGCAVRICYKERMRELKETYNI